MTDDIELGGEDETEPTSSVTFSTSLREEQTSICVFKKHKHLFF